MRRKTRGWEGRGNWGEEEHCYSSSQPRLTGSPASEIVDLLKFRIDFVEAPHSFWSLIETKDLARSNARIITLRI